MIVMMYPFSRSLQDRLLPISFSDVWIWFNAPVLYDSWPIEFNGRLFRMLADPVLVMVLYDRSTNIFIYFGTIVGRRF